MHNTMKWLPVMAVCALMSCQEAAAPSLTPQQTLQAFSDAVRKGDSPTAFRLLSKDTRAHAEQRATEISTASGGMIKSEPMAMMSQTGFKTAAEFTIKAVESTELVSVLEVTRETGVERVRLIKEEGRWVLDLSSLFSERAP